VRQGSRLYDAIGTYDMTTKSDYYERGINLRHGNLTEYFVDYPEYIVRVPAALRDIASRSARTPGYPNFTGGRDGHPRLFRK
jgi:hypothetical protein